MTGMRSFYAASLAKRGFTAPKARLARDLDLKKLAETTQVIGLAEVPDVARRILDGKIRGRMVVDVNL
jgi:hypothetical protein